MISGHITKYGCLSPLFRLCLTVPSILSEATGALHHPAHTQVKPRPCSVIFSAKVDHLPINLPEQNATNLLHRTGSVQNCQHINHWCSYPTAERRHPKVVRVPHIPHRYLLTIKHGYVVKSNSCYLNCASCHWITATTSVRHVQTQNSKFNCLHGCGPGVSCGAAT